MIYILRHSLLSLVFIIVSAVLSAQVKENHSLTGKTNASMQQVLIDQFVVPEKARQKFQERLSISMRFIGGLTGLVHNDAYERTDEQGNLVCVTVAVWENKEAVAKAKAAVQQEYQKQGFVPAKMFEELGITFSRALYSRSTIKQ